MIKAIATAIIRIARKCKRCCELVKLSKALIEDRYQLEAEQGLNTGKDHASLLDGFPGHLLDLLLRLAAFRLHASPNAAIITGPARTRS